MSGDSKYTTNVLNKSSITIQKQGTSYFLLFKFTKSALEELGCDTKALALGLDNREDIAKFVTLIQTYPNYHSIRINNKFLIYTKKELNVVSSSPLQESPIIESLEAALDTEGEDSELLILDSTDDEKLPKRTSDHEKTKTRIIPREELLSKSYQETE
ncbi:hypothetical protein JW851_01570 [Candidatus Woesearchaeota archaeon]|nr:hypothetical protein [Candidatus Woesearchaeota archaeon]